MNKPAFIIVFYVLATAFYVLFHFKFIHTNRLVESNNLVAYVASFSLFLLIPLTGLIHLAFRTLRRGVFWNLVVYSTLAGLAGPLLLHIFISRSDDADSVWGYTMLPVAWLAFSVADFVLLLLCQYLMHGTAR